MGSGAGMEQGGRRGGRLRCGGCLSQAGGLWWRLVWLFFYRLSRPCCPLPLLHDKQVQFSPWVSAGQPRYKGLALSTGTRPHTGQYMLSAAVDLYVDHKYHLNNQKIMVLPEPSKETLHILPAQGGLCGTAEGGQRRTACTLRRIWLILLLPCLIPLPGTYWLLHLSPYHRGCIARLCSSALQLVIKQSKGEF